jgi:hypothetical protein
MTDKDAETMPAWVGWARLGIGLAQGVGLYFLSEMNNESDAALRAAVWATLWFVPVLVVGGLGAMRLTTLAWWTLVAVAIAAGLAGYDILRQPEAETRNYYYGPSVAFFVVPLLLFVGHHLVAAGDEARRWIAPYERYFDLGWRHGAQLLLAILFTGAFWAVLMLGAALFNLIGLTWLQELVTKGWFAYPATCVVFAAAIHMTDLRSGLVRGARALGLVLLSWLLPAMTGLAAAFFLALPFQGLEPLWATRAATTILLSAAATLVVLVNAAYQDGLNPPNAILRWSAMIASVLMTPLAMLAAYALYLRIDQYGLTPERIYAVALLLIGACYAVSYAIGAFAKQWMKTLEIGNIVSAVVVMVVAIALFTPIADPARLAVDDQMRRLASGRVSAEDFDVAFLRFNGARYGEAALRRLRDDGSSEESRALGRRAQAALAMRNRYEARERVNTPTQPLVIIMHPDGAELPEGFAAGQVEDLLSRVCSDQMRPCHGYLADFNSDGVNELVAGQHRANLWVYRKVGESWFQAGSVNLPDGAEEAMRRGEYRIVPAEIGDLMVGDQRVRMQRDYGDGRQWASSVQRLETPEDDAPPPNR